MNNYLKTGTNPNVYCIMCVRFIIAQRQITIIKYWLYAKNFMALLDWFIDISGYSDFI